MLHLPLEYRKEERRPTLASWHVRARFRKRDRPRYAAVKVALMMRASRETQKQRVNVRPKSSPRDESTIPLDLRSQACTKAQCHRAPGSPSNAPETVTALGPVSSASCAEQSPGQGAVRTQLPRSLHAARPTVRRFIYLHNQNISS